MNLQPTAPTMQRTSTGYELQPFVLPNYVTISGGISVEGDLHVEGRVDGAVHCNTLHVAKDAHIDGRIVAEHVIVDGSISGEVFARRVALSRTCRVEAEICQASMTLEEGAYFDGSSRSHEDPLALANLAA